MYTCKIVNRDTQQELAVTRFDFTPIIGMIIEVDGVEYTVVDFRIKLEPNLLKTMSSHYIGEIQIDVQSWSGL